MAIQRSPNRPARSCHLRCCWPRPLRRCLPSLRRRLAALAVMFLILASTVSCDRSSVASRGRTPIRVEVSFGAVDVEVHRAMEDYLKRAAGESRQKIELGLSHAYASTSRQISQIRDSIARRPDILVIMPEDSKAVLPLIGEAHEAGIKVIVYNRQTDPSANPALEPDVYIGLDTVDQAYTTGIALMKRMRGNGFAARIINVTGPATDRNAVNRTVGLERAVAELKGSIVAEVPTRWDPKLAESGLDRALAEHPEANAIFCASDWLMAGVEASLRKANRWAPYGDARHFFLGSQDVYPNGEDLVRQGEIDVDTAFDIWPMTTMLIQAILTIGNGARMSNDIFIVPGRVVTAHNVDSIGELWSRTYRAKKDPERPEDALLDPSLRYSLGVTP
jgi:ribose transport system substrate-binding protein